MRERSIDEKVTLLSERIGLLEARSDSRSLSAGLQRLDDRIGLLEQRLKRIEAWSQAIGLSLGSLKGPD